MYLLPFPSKPWQCRLWVPHLKFAYAGSRLDSPTLVSLCTPLPMQKLGSLTAPTPFTQPSSALMQLKCSSSATHLVLHAVKPSTSIVLTFLLLTE